MENISLSKEIKNWLKQKHPKHRNLSGLLSPLLLKQKL